MRLDEKAEAIAKQLDPRLRKAFLDAVKDVTSSIDIRALERAIAAGDIEGALRVVNLTQGFFGPFREAILAAYAAGGSNLLNAVPQRIMKIAVRFDGTNPRAEAWARANSSQKIVEILEPTRAVIRDKIAQGIANGKNPRATALEIAGRIDKVSGRRRGGIVGLSPDLIAHLDNAKAELSDPAKMKNYLTRALRDRRYDKRVRDAIKAGKPLSRADYDLLTMRYSDRLLAYRAERIARTETTAALSAGRTEGMAQLIGSGQVRVDQVKKRWKSALLKSTRDTHIGLHNDIVPFDQPFRSPMGALMMHPCDTSLGAGAAEIVNCRCTYEYVIDF